MFSLITTVGLNMYRLARTELDTLRKNTLACITHNHRMLAWRNKYG